MFDWVTTSSTAMELSLEKLAIRLLLAWGCGCVVAWLAGLRRGEDEIDTLSLTLVLMSILIAMATQIIGDNIARAFSLVGALSIVRFRAAVPATRDVAFVLAAVVGGMAVGAGQYWVCGLGLIVVGLATIFSASEPPSPTAQSASEAPPASPAWRLTLSLGLNGLEATHAWKAAIERFAEAYQLISTETSRRGGGVELNYRLTPKAGADAVDMIAVLNAIPAVESVAIKVG